MDEYIKTLNEKQKKESLAALETVRQGNSAIYGNAQDSVNEAFGNAMTEMFRDNQRRAADTNATLKAQDLNTGAGSQASLVQQNDVANARYKLDVAKAAADRQLELARKNEEEKYKAAVQKAIANQDYNAANQLYEEYKDAQSTAQSQVDAMLAKGLMPDAALVSKSGYSTDYVTAKYNKVQASAAAAKTAETASKAAAKTAETASTMGDTARAKVQLPATTKMQNEAAQKAQTAATDPTAAAKQAVKTQTQAVVRQKLNTLANAKERQSYVQNLYVSGVLDKSAYNELSMIATMMPAGSRKALTTAQITSLGADKKLTEAEQSAVASITGGTPYKVPTTAAEAKAVLYDYYARQGEKARKDYAKWYEENAQYIGGNTKPIDLVYNTLTDLKSALDKDNAVGWEITNGVSNADKYKEYWGQLDARLKALSQSYDYGYVSPDEYAGQGIYAREKAVRENCEKLQEYFDTHFEGEKPTGGERVGNMFKSWGQGILATLNNLAYALGHSSSAGVGQSLETINANEAELNKLGEKANALYLEAEESLAEAKKHASKGTQFAIDLGKVALEVLGDAALSSVTGGYGGLAFMAARTAGSTYATMTASGVDESKAMLVAFERAAMGVATESLGGIMGKTKLFAKLEEKIFPEVVAKLNSNALGKMAVNGLEEAGEEALENMANSVFDYCIGDRGQLLLTDEEFAQMLYEMSIGYIVGFAGGGVNVGIKKLKGKANETAPTADEVGEVDGAELADAMVEAVIADMAKNGTLSEKTAEAMSEKVEAKAEERFKDYHDEAVAAAEKAAGWRTLDNGWSVKAEEKDGDTVVTIRKGEVFDTRSFSGANISPEETDRVAAEMIATYEGQTTQPASATEEAAAATEAPQPETVSQPTQTEAVNEEEGEEFSATDAQAEEVFSLLKSDISQSPAAEAGQTNEVGAPYPDERKIKSLGADIRSVGEEWLDNAEQNNEPTHETSKMEREALAADERRDREVIPIPKKDPKGNRTSKLFNTAIQSPATPDEYVKSLVDDAAKGYFSYLEESNSEQIKEAHKLIEEGDWHSAFAKFKADCENGIVSGYNTALGIVLYNEAVNAASEMTADEDAAVAFSDAVDVLVLLQANVREGARGVQAASILAKLSDVSKLYSLQKTVEGAISGVKKRGEGKNYKTKKKAEEEITDAVQETASEIADEMQGKKAEKKEFTDEVSELVANGVSATISPPKAKSVEQEFADEVLRYARETLPPRIKQERMTDAELLRELFNNKNDFQDVWEGAKGILTERYADNEVMLDKLEKLFADKLTEANASMFGSMAIRAIATKAIAKAAADTQQNRRTILQASTVGAGTEVAVESIFTELQKTVKAEGEDAIMLHAAVEAYVDEVLRDAEAKVSPADMQKMVDNRIKEAMRKIGAQFSKVTKMSETERAAIEAEIIAQFMVRYDVPAANVQQVIDVVDEHFSALVAEKAQEQLSGMFRERGEAPTKADLQQKFIETLRLGQYDDGTFAAQITEKLFGIDSITVPKEMYAAYLEALNKGDEKAAEEAYNAIKKYVASRVPSTFVDKLNAFRYFYMLANPLTHIRNIEGNLAFTAPRQLKNYLATAGEWAYNKFSSNPIERTTTVLNRSSTADRALIAACKLDGKTKTIKQMLKGTGHYNEVMQDINEHKQIFKNKGFDAFLKSVGVALEAEDSWTSTPVYAVALARYLKINGVTADMVLNDTVDAELMARARTKAIKEALEATYRDLNAFTNLISEKLRARYTGKVGWDIVAFGYNSLITAFSPFLKTVANVVVRAEEYSPLGFVNTAADIAAHNRGEDVSVADIINTAAKATAGTLALSVGMFLRAMGLFNTPDDDDKRNRFQKALGIQDYSVNIGDKTYDISYLSPVTIFISTGAKLYDILSDNSDKDVWDYIDTVFDIAEPLIQMSMLDSLETTIEAITDENLPGGIVEKLAYSMAMSLASQFIPTLGGNIERLFEDERTTTWIDTESRTPATVQYWLGKVGNKVPVIEFQQAPYTNIKGDRQSTGNFGQRLINNFLNPAYVNEDISTDADNELLRLSEAGYEDVLPRVPNGYTTYKVDGKTKHLSQYQLPNYAEVYGKTWSALWEEAYKSNEFKSMTDAEKAKLFSNIEQYAKSKAARKVDRNAEVSEWYDNVPKTSPTQYFIDKTRMAAYCDSKGDSTQATKAAYLINKYDGADLYKALKEQGMDGLSEDIKTANLAGVDTKNYIKVYTYKNKATSKDLNGDGKISEKYDYTVGEQVHDYISGLPLTASEKQKLWAQFYKSEW